MSGEETPVDSKDDDQGIVGTRTLDIIENDRRIPDANSNITASTINESIIATTSFKDRSNIESVEPDTTDIEDVKISKNKQPVAGSGDLEYKIIENSLPDSVVDTDDNVEASEENDFDPKISTTVSNKVLLLNTNSPGCASLPTEEAEEDLLLRWEDDESNEPVGSAYEVDPTIAVSNILITKDGAPESPTVDTDFCSKDVQDNIVQEEVQNSPKASCGLQKNDNDVDDDEINVSSSNDRTTEQISGITDDTMTAILQAKPNRDPTPKIQDIFVIDTSKSPNTDDDTNREVTEVNQISDINAETATVSKISTTSPEQSSTAIALEKTVSTDNIDILVTTSESYNADDSTMEIDSQSDETETAAELTTLPNIIAEDSKHRSVKLEENLLKTNEISTKKALYTSITANTSHRLNQPDVMLEIPMQELIDIDETAEVSTIEGDDDDDSQKSLDDSPESPDKSDQNTESGDAFKENADDESSVIDKLPEDILIIQNYDNLIGNNVDNSLKAGIDLSMGDKFEHKDTSTNIDPTTNIDGDTLDKTPETSESNQPEDLTQLITSKGDEESKLDQLNQPSTSGKKTLDAVGASSETDDEVPEVTDSLGLLAESSRMMEDYEEPDDDDEGEPEGDDDEDFYQDDESSNHMTAEHSEDSNAPHTVKEECDNTAKTSATHNDKSYIIMAETEADTKIQDDSAKADILTPVTIEKFEKVHTNKNLPQEEQVMVQPDDSDKVSDVLSTDKEIHTKTDPSDISDNMSMATDRSSDKETSTVDTKDTRESTNQPVQSPMKAKKLEIYKPKPTLNFVDLEETSSEDEVKPEEPEPEPEPETQADPQPEPDVEVVVAKIDIDGVTSVNIPADIEVMSSGGNTSEILAKAGEVVISGVPKPPPHKLARLNTSEVSIKTVSNAESTLLIPEAMTSDTAATSKPYLSLEVFNLDSDEDSSGSVAKTKEEDPPKASDADQVRSKVKCVNHLCEGGVKFAPADRAALAHYNALRKRRAVICDACLVPVHDRAKRLMTGVKELTPLLGLEMGKESEDLVEISDSESEDEDEPPEDTADTIGAKGASLLEDNLADIINDTWKKYKMDDRLKDTQEELNTEIAILERESKEIDAMLTECQMATDKLRNEFYATFECRRQQLPGLIISDTPYAVYSVVEEAVPLAENEVRQAKRRLSSECESPVKRPPIPLGYAPLDDSSAPQNVPESKSPVPSIDAWPKDDDDKDISVVKLSAEAAPADLPPRAPGELIRAPLKAGVMVYAMKNAFGAWLRGTILDCEPRNANSDWTMCLVSFVDKQKRPCKLLPGRCLAYSEPSEYRMTIGTRVIALFKDENNTHKRESFYSGIVAEIPNPVNNYRYLVFFDVGSAQYIRHSDTRLVCESSLVVWEDMHPFSRSFVRDYLSAYPERPMVRLHAGQKLRTEWNGKWWSSSVVRVDASLVEVHFPGDGRTEWIYRGSTRLEPLYNELQAAQRAKHRALPRTKAQPRSNLPMMPYVEYTRTDEQGTDNNQATEEQPPPVATPQQQKHSDEMRRQRAVAKKSTTSSTPAPAIIPAGNLDSVTSRVVYYTPKNAVKPYKMASHICSPRCKRTDVLALKDLRTYNPLAKPLLSGWERQLVRYKGQKEVMYRTPCGRRVRSMKELHRYLRVTRSDMPVDLFDFHPATHCLAEFVLNKCIVWKRDLSHGKENVPVPCVNYYDESLPEFCSYNTERTPTAGVPLNLDPEFLCGCNCTDDCEDKTKCACWQLTLEGARTIGMESDVGYTYRRLPEPLPSGIYECNSRCKCKSTCLNRVVQHPLQLKLQVFKTLNRGWGIRALNDVPKGSFLCVYAGNLLTDATANLDGLNEGDEYLAELDYIEVVEQMKEGYEDDIPEGDRALDKKDSGKDDDEEMSPSEDEEVPDRNDQDDDDFMPGNVDPKPTKFNKLLRTRRTDSEDSKESTVKPKEREAADDCITISDDEEVRQPTRFTAEAGMGANAFVPKYRSVRSYFGEDEACYIMDAKVQGNIGRYLNHSCCPNVFVQNVFVDTHDPRFPWVSFFALSHIRAGTELTWNYNYDIGSVPGKVLYCYCGAPNCRGRLL